MCGVWGSCHVRAVAGLVRHLFFQQLSQSGQPAPTSTLNKVPPPTSAGLRSSPSPPCRLHRPSRSPSQPLRARLRGHRRPRPVPCRTARVGSSEARSAALIAETPGTFALRGALLLHRQEAPATRCGRNFNLKRRRLGNASGAGGASSRCWRTGELVRHRVWPVKLCRRSLIRLDLRRRAPPVSARPRRARSRRGRRSRRRGVAADTARDCSAALRAAAAAL